MTTNDPESCPMCGSDNECGLAVGKPRCWCFDLPVMKDAAAPTDDAPDLSCLCEACLQRELQKQVSTAAAPRLEP